MVINDHFTYSTPRNGTESAMLTWRKRPRAAIGLMKRDVLVFICCVSVSDARSVGFVGSM